MKRRLPGTMWGTGRDSVDRPSEIEALADMLDANRFSAATVQGFGVGQWHAAALAAQVPDPSAETRAMVVRVLQQREAARAGAFDEWLARYRGRLEWLLNSEQENSK